MTTLTELDRRTIGHLGVPRNAASLSHELRVDQYSKTREDRQVHRHLGQLADRGLVVRLGEVSDTAATAAALERHATALTMPDDKAAIWSRRRARPEQAWEVEGDVWSLTDEGLLTLKEPVSDKAFTTSELLGLAQAQAEGVRTDDTAGARGAAVRWLNPHAEQYMDLPWMTPEEYNAWLGVVAADHEGRWGAGEADAIRKLAVAAGGAGWTDAVENRIINWENQKTAMPALVDPWFMCLVILALTDSDTATTARDGSHIPTYTGYAEKSVAGTDMASGSSGSAANSSAIIFAACTAGSGTILGFGNKETNSTTGDLRKYGTTASTVVSTTQTPAQFAAGTYTTSAD